MIPRKIWLAFRSIRRDIGLVRRSGNEFCSLLSAPFPRRRRTSCGSFTFGQDTKGKVFCEGSSPIRSSCARSIQPRTIQAERPSILQPERDHPDKQPNLSCKGPLWLGQFLIMLRASESYWHGSNVHRGRLFANQGVRPSNPWDEAAGLRVTAFDPSLSCAAAPEFCSCGKLLSTQHCNNQRESSSGQHH